jgi:hypothetical protein
MTVADELTDSRPRSRSQSSFKLWLCNLDNGTNWGEGDMFAAGARLRNLFDMVTDQRGCAFSSVDFSYSPRCAWPEQPQHNAVRCYELLAYLLPSSNRSLLVRYYQLLPSQLGQSGTTYETPDGVLTEVYLDVMAGDPETGRLGGNLIFHELMHNKLDSYRAGSPVTDIHVAGGGGLARGGPNLPPGMAIKSYTEPTPGNLSLMARFLDRDHLQNTEFLMFGSKAMLSKYP